MKILFVVPDGVGLRNYLYSGLIDVIIEQDYSLAVLHKLPEGAIRETKKLHHSNIEWVELPAWKEGFVERLLRDGAAYARLRNNAKKTANSSIMEFWTKHNPRLKILIMQRLAEFVGVLISMSYGLVIKAEELRNILIRKNRHYKAYIKTIERVNPDVLFCTHQRAVLAAPAMLAAQELGIKTLTAIFSWDNLPKGRMTISADFYAVWSVYMKNEMKLFYPEINQDKVLVTGTPQFEFYKQERLLIERDDFANLYGLNPYKKWICYSGDDELTSPYDPLYLEDLLFSINQVEIEERPQIVLRKAPVDKSGRFDYLSDKYSEYLVVVDPIWNKDDDIRGFSTIYPKYDDVKLLVNVVAHCAAVVNVGSTMAHDFAQMDKPAFYVNYDIVKRSKWTTKFIYKFQHFRSMGNLKPVEWINEPSDWIKLIKTVADGKEIKNDRLRWFNEIHSPEPEESTKLLAKAILNLN